jgi:cell division protein FtsB
MPDSQVVINRTRATIVFILFTISAYFIYHILTGDRGLLSYIRLSKELEEKKAILSDLQEERTNLEKKVALMDNKNIDQDMLDELARKNLGLMSKDEEVWIIEEDK